MREISREHTLKFWKKFLDMAELIIAPSFFCGKGPGEYVATEKLIVLYPGIDTGLLKEVENEDVFVARKRFNLPEDFFLVGAVGAFVSRKGHDHLIKASANLIKNGNKIGIVLCGPGSKDWLVSLSKKEGIENNVYFFTGLSEKDLFLLYRSLDLYCDASNTPRACLGMSLTEAMLVGVPAIAYNNGGLPEIVKEGDNGLLVPLDDIDRLSQGIERMSLLPKEERQKMGERGKIMCKKIVDLDAMAVKKIGLLIKVKQNYK
jgi:glycosyltransferase involved in cell wall biosynthesis